MMGKHHRVQFIKSEERSKGVLDFVHSDVWQSESYRSKGGCFITFIDDHSLNICDLGVLDEP